MEVLKVRPSITTLIKSVAKDQGITNYIILDIQTNQKGEGYLGEIYMVTVKDNDSNKQLDVVIKAAFTDDKIREMTPIRMIFDNEIYFYSEIYPLYQKLEKERRITDTIQLVPKCLIVSSKEKEEMLALENLKALGFETFDKRSVLDGAHVELIFKTYGRLHAYSFVLRDQHPQMYSKITEGLFNVYSKFMEKGFFADHLEEMGKLAAKCLIPGDDDVVFEKYEKYLNRNIANIFGDIASETPDYSAILHGDCWSNNMLFRYENDLSGKKPVDIRLIDWQLIKTGSPACDLSYCLYSGASKKVFDNLNHYLHIYHNSFSKLVKELGSDPKKLFPFSVLKEHWKKYSRFGMIMALAIWKMKLTDKEDLIDLRDGYDMDEMKSLFANCRFSEEDYSKRIRELLWHMTEIDAL